MVVNEIIQNILFLRKPKKQVIMQLMECLNKEAFMSWFIVVFSSQLFDK